MSRNQSARAIIAPIKNNLNQSWRARPTVAGGVEEGNEASLGEEEVTGSGCSRRGSFFLFFCFLGGGFPGLSAIKSQLYI